MIAELIQQTQKGVPVKTSYSKYDLAKAWEEGKHRCMQEEYVASFQHGSRCRYQRFGGYTLGCGRDIKVRFIHDHSFEPDTVRGKKGGTRNDSFIRDVPRYLYGEALPKLLAEIIVNFKFPNKRILLIVSTPICWTHFKTFA